MISYQIKFIIDKISTISVELQRLSKYELDEIDSLNYRFMVILNKSHFIYDTHYMIPILYD